MVNTLYESLPDNDFYKPIFNNYGGIYGDNFGLCIVVFRSYQKKYYLTDVYIERDSFTLDNMATAIKAQNNKYEYVTYNINNSKLLYSYLKSLNYFSKAYELNLIDGMMLLTSMKNNDYLKVNNEKRADVILEEMETFKPEQTSHILNAMMIALADNNPYNLNNWLDALII